MHIIYRFVLSAVFQIVTRYVEVVASCRIEHVALHEEYIHANTATEVDEQVPKVPVPEFNNSGRMVVRCYGENDITTALGAGAWVASAAELCRLVASIDGDRTVPDVISPQAVKLMTQEMPDHQFSLGWNFTPRNRPWIRTGSLVGTSALVLRYPDGECWVFITNTSTWKGHKFSQDTMALFEKLRKRFGSKMPKRNMFIN